MDKPSLQIVNRKLKEEYYYHQISTQLQFTTPFVIRVKFGNYVYDLSQDSYNSDDLDMVFVTPQYMYIYRNGQSGDSTLNFKLIDFDKVQVHTSDIVLYHASQPQDSQQDVYIVINLPIQGDLLKPSEQITYVISETEYEQKLTFIVNTIPIPYSSFDKDMDYFSYIDDILFDQDKKKVIDIPVYELSRSYCITPYVIQRDLQTTKIKKLHIFDKDDSYQDQEYEVQEIKQAEYQDLFDELQQQLDNQEQRTSIITNGVSSSSQKTLTNIQKSQRSYSNISSQQNSNIPEIIRESLSNPPEWITYDNDKYDNYFNLEDHDKIQVFIQLGEPQEKLELFKEFAKQPETEQLKTFLELLRCKRCESKKHDNNTQYNECPGKLCPDCGTHYFADQEHTIIQCEKYQQWLSKYGDGMLQDYVWAFAEEKGSIIYDSLINWDLINPSDERDSDEQFDIKFAREFVDKFNKKIENVEITNDTKLWFIEGDYSKETKHWFKDIKDDSKNIRRLQFDHTNKQIYELLNIIFELYLDLIQQDIYHKDLYHIELIQRVYEEIKSTEDLGLERYEIKADGNCLYHSMSAILKMKDYDYRGCKEKLTNYITQKFKDGLVQYKQYEDALGDNKWGDWQFIEFMNNILDEDPKTKGKGIKLYGAMLQKPNRKYIITHNDLQLKHTPIDEYDRPNAFIVYNQKRQHFDVIRAT